MRNEGRHVALIGIPGAGKSTVARFAADILNYPLVDFDKTIERRAGRTIAEIFRDQGELAFREMEAALTQELVSAPASVLSPGGGWVTRPDVVALIRPRTLLVWLTVSPAVAVRRMGAGVSRRPLLMKGDPAAVLAGILAEREGLYSMADVTIDTEVHTPQAVAHHVARLASGWPGRVG
jgi:shikimate kinase